MNEDSGGTVPPSAYSLSEAEEAALLAAYGTEAPSAVGLDWAAPSRFKSRMGDGDVFLTGAIHTSDVHEDQASDTEPSLLPPRPPRGARAYSDPLDFYVLQYVPSLILPSRSTPAALAVPVGNAVSTYELTRGTSAAVFDSHHPETPSRFSPVLRSGKEWERRASLAVRGVPTTAFASHLLSNSSDGGGGPRGRNSTTTNGESIDDDAAGHDTEFDKLVGLSADLLKDADDLLQVLTKPRTADHSIAEVQKAVEELRRRESLLSEDAVDQHWEREEVLHADEESRTRELLEQARLRRQRLQATLTSLHGTEERKDTALTPAVAGTALFSPSSSPPRPLPPELDHLYAFEMELPRTAKLTEAAKDSGGEAASLTQDAALMSSAEALAVFPHTVESAARALADDVTLPKLLLRSSEVLQSIRAAESREVQILPSSEKLKVHTVSTAVKANRDALGLVELPNFVARLDALLVPTKEEWKEREHLREEASPLPVGSDAAPAASPANASDPRGRNGGAEGSIATAAAATVLPQHVSMAEPSLEEIRRVAAIESFLLQREAEESRAMRREEELLERERQAAADLDALYAERVAALHQDALSGIQRITAAETSAFKELCSAESKDASLARQAEELRHLQEIEALSYTAMMSWEVLREQLLQDEALRFVHLTRDAAEAKERALAATQHRVEKEAAAARALLEVMWQIFEESRAVLQEGTSRTQLLPSTAVGGCSAWYRSCIEPLRLECQQVVKWVLAQHKQIERVRELLAEAACQYHRHITATVSATEAPRDTEHAVCIPAAPPPPTPPGGKDNGSAVVSATSTAGSAAATVLNASRLLHVMWPALNAAVQEPRQAAQYLARWSLALDDISSVDWEGLENVKLRREGERVSAVVASLAVSHFTQELDLGGNKLEAVDVRQTLRAFPMLQRLTLSHAQLTRLDCGVTARGRLSPLGGPPLSRSAPTSATAPEKRPTSSSHLRHISAARNHALAEHVHLVEIDVSANMLTSLAPLDVVVAASLTRCTAVDNRLASLGSLMACTQLRSVGVARNRLTSLEGLCSLRLLREVDAGDNALRDFIHDASEELSPVSVLTRLSLSHNRITTLSSSLLCVYPCLSQLFVNHNELTSLRAEAMAWLPLLRVLQAEGNRLVDIGGLSHCTRLESARLSHNQLATVEALLPLTSCRRLRVLDLSGNPIFPDSGSSESQRASCILQRALRWLEELNNTPLRPTSLEVKKAASRERKLADVPYSSFFSVALPSVGRPLQSYRDGFAALCWDAMLQHAQEEHELQEALLSRKLNRARGWEATLTTENTASKNGIAVATLYSFTAAQRDTRRAEHDAELRRFDLDRDTLATWRAVAERCAAGQASPLFSNRHEVHSGYRQRADDHLAKLARAYIAEWLMARVLVWRARRTLQQLRRAHQETESFRREAAARCIQPLWRGAALRSRLKRLLHGVDAEDDDANFAKVDVADWLTEDPSALAPVERLLHTVVVNAAGGVAAVPFSIPATLLTRPAGGGDDGRGEAAQPLAFTPAPPTSGGGAGGPRRAQSDASPTSRPSMLQQQQAPSPLVPRAQSASANADLTSTKEPVSLEDQWGPTVAAQIRKKQQKNTRANRERMRKEFTHDPLRVQQEVRGVGTNTVRKRK